MGDVSPNIQQIFSEVIERESEAERLDYLEQACGDPDIRQRVEALLRAHVDAGNFFGGPNPVVERSAGPIADFVGSQIGPYQICEQIGEGGMGVVYVAEQVEPVRRQVAVKIVKPGMDSKQVLARFDAERQVLAVMDHPHIAKVLDGGNTDKGRPYFVMELVKGLAITQYCDKCQLGIDERLKLFAAVCQAVQHAHHKGIIHRDLKPSNVLIAIQDGQPAPKIIDFDVAKAIGQQMTTHTLRTQFAQLIGTPMYMSPEQAELRPIDVDTRSDIYSLGVLLYELLTGTTPISSERLSEVSFDELRRIIREEEPPRPSTQVSTLSANASTTLTETRRLDSRHLLRQLRGELDWIVMKALAKDRTRRYESANELAADIERYLSNEPVQARPTSTIYRIRKFTDRNRALVGSLAAVFVALTVGLAMATVGFVTAQKRLAEVIEEQDNNRVLIDMLSEIYGIPWGTEVYGQQHTVRQSLEKISNGLKDRLRDNPKVEIEIRLIAARTYRKSRDFETARGHLERALELTRRVYGPRSERCADVLTDFADEIQWQRGVQLSDPAEIQDYAEQALSIYDELGVKTRDTAHALFCLARSIGQDVARQDEVEQHLRGALQITRDLAGDRDSWMQVFTLWDLAIHLASKLDGGSEEANEKIQEAVDMSERFNGEQHTVTASVVAGRAACYRHYGNIDGALKSYRQAWQIYRDTGLENEPAGHKHALMLAEMHHASHQHNEAHEVLDELEKICREHDAWNSLAECHYMRGWGHLIREDYEAAELSLRKCLKVAGEHPDEQAEVAPYARFCLALSLEARDAIADAQREYDKILAVTGYLLKAPYASATTRYGHAWAILHSGTKNTDRLKAAFDTARRGLEQAKTQPKFGREPHFLLAMGMAQYKLGDEKQAIESLRDGLDSIKYPFPSLHAHYKDIPKSRRELETTLAKYLVKKEDVEKAKRVYQDGITARSNQLGADHLQVALAKLRFGTFLLKHEPFGSAEKVLLHAHRELSIIPQAADANRGRAAAQLAQLYKVLGKPQEEAKWQTAFEKTRRSTGEDDK